MDKAWKLFLTWARWRSEDDDNVVKRAEAASVLHVNLNNIEMCVRGDVL